MSKRWYNQNMVNAIESLFLSRVLPLLVVATCCLDGGVHSPLFPASVVAALALWSVPTLDRIAKSAAERWPGTAPDGVQALWRMSDAEFKRTAAAVLARMGYSLHSGIEGGALPMLVGTAPLGTHFAVVGVAHRNLTVGAAAVRSVDRQMTFAKRQTIIMASGFFDDDAKAYASEHGVRLIEGDELAALAGL